MSDDFDWWGGSLCEICGPENRCTCGGCQCMWCRAREGRPLNAAERRRYDDHCRALQAERQRLELRSMSAQLGQRLRQHQKPQDR